MFDDKSLGIIICKKQHIGLISMQPYEDTYYQRVLYQFKQGYIYFLCLDGDRMSFENTKQNGKLKIVPR